MNVCQFATGTSTEYRPMTIPNISFEGIYIGLQIWRHIYLFTNLILFASQKHISILLDDDNLVISGCDLVRSDHPSNTKRGGVCLYYKNYLPLRVLNISYLKECLNFELKIGDKSCNFVALYWSLSQSQDDFDNLLW